jgi:hypothetical protein
MGMAGEKRGGGQGEGGRCLTLGRPSALAQGQQVEKSGNRGLPYEQ